MTHVNIIATIEAALTTIVLNPSGALRALFWPFCMILIGILLQAAPLLIYGPLSFTGSMIAWIAGYSALISIGTAAAAYNWQRFLLVEKIQQKEVIEDLLWQQIFTPQFARYAGYSLLLAVPYIVIQGLFLWNFLQDQLSPEWISMIPYSGLIYLLVLPIWMRLSLVLCAVAAGHKDVSVFQAFRLGRGSGWRIAVANIGGGLALAVFFLVGGLVFVIVMAILGFVLVGALGDVGTVILAIITGFVQSVALPLGACVPAGILAISYAQLHTDFDNPIEKLKIPEEGLLEADKAPAYGQKRSQ